MATIYISTTGSGKNTGTSADSALGIENLDKAIKLAGAGGTVAIIADKGAYNITSALSIYSGGSASGAVTIKGVSSTGADMAAHFASTRSTAGDGTGASGSEVFKIMSSNASNLTFENFSFSNVASAFRVGADVSNITVKHAAGTNVGMFFENYATGANKTATISGLDLSDITVNGYTKGVVRLQYDTNDVKMSHLVGDSQFQDAKDSIAAGVHLEGTVHNVQVSDSVMRNAVSADAYYNGDGYATERGVYDVTFTRAVASGNADGGFDLKSLSTTLIDTVAEGNGRNYRFWGEITMKNGIGLDPHVLGGTGGQEQIQVMKGANVKVIGGMLSDSGSLTQVLLNEGGVLTLTDTQIVYAAGARLMPGKGLTLLDQSLVKTTGATGTYSLDGAELVQSLFAPAAPVVVAPVEIAPVVLDPIVIVPIALPPIVTVPAEVVPAVTVPVVTAPVVTAPVETAPVVSTPAATTPVVTTPAETVPASVTPVEVAPVVTAPVQVAPVTPTPVVNTPVVTAPVEVAPVAAAPVVAAPVAPIRNVMTSTGAAETFSGTAGQDVFVFKTGAIGKDVVTNFGKTDLLALGSVLPDGNKDGLVTFGGDSKIDISKTDTITIADLKKEGVRALGQGSDGLFYYGDARVRPDKASESTLQNDKMTGDATDKTANTFFFDTALGMNLGTDTIAKMGAKDILVTTTKMADVAVGGHWDASGGVFGLADGLGTVGVSNIKGQAVASLEFDGNLTIDGVTYYVYSQLGSAAGLGDLHV